MRRKKIYKFNNCHNSNKIFLLILLVINICFISNIAKSQEGNLNINITNLNDVPIDQIKEGDYFKVSVYDFLSETIYLSDVYIIFNNVEYNIDSNSVNNEIKIKAPNVEYNKEFTIYVLKEGYEQAETVITILDVEKPDLFIYHKEYIVDEGKLFLVTITENEKDGNPVEGVKVYIQNSPQSQSDITDKYGNAKLVTPNNIAKFTLIASKEGYNDGTAIFDVNIEMSWWESIINDPYFFVYVAIILLIISVAFVNIRQNRSIFKRAKQISNDIAIEKYTEKSDSSYNKQSFNIQHFSNEPVRNKSTNDAKVEEIRISRLNKVKEIIPVDTKKHKTEKGDKSKEIYVRNSEWFKGTDQIRYEIDKIIGEVDENGVDKWYEGVENIKEKIDEKMKKKGKNKN